jgi:hypothetical protein
LRFSRKCGILRGVKQKGRSAAPCGLFGALALLAAAAACSSSPPVAISFAERIEAAPRAPYRILEYRDGPDAVPRWLGLYLEGGERRIEAAPGYEGRYVFVVSARSANFPTLAMWSGFFRAGQDVGHAVFMRLYERLLAESSGLPDYYLGDFFEAFLKKVAGRRFEGASREDDYWIRVEVEDAAAVDDALPVDEAPRAAGGAWMEEYRYYILAAIDKAELEAAAALLFDEALAGVALPRAQRAAALRLRNNLFAGF